MTKKKSENASWLKPLPEEFANEGMSSKRRITMTSITLVVFIGFGALIWSSYTSEGDELGPVPVVRADNSVVKEKPEDPGGQEILFQDREVFDRVDNLDKDDADVIASSAEIPLRRPTVEIPEEPTNVEIPKEVAQEAEQIEPSAPAPAPAPTPAPTPIVAVSSGNFMIQIGAFAEKSKAEALWTEVKKENSTALANIEPTYMRVDLENKGVLYRVRGGMLQSRKAADDVCASLKSNKRGCMVVTR